MDKPMILQIKEFKESAADVVNEHINTVPADVMADFFEKLVSQLRQIAAKQYEEATKIYSEQKTTE